MGSKLTVINGHVETGFSALSVALGLLAFPVLLLAWQWLRGQCAGHASSHGTRVLPLGRNAAAAIKHLVTIGEINAYRCLIGLPHPSGPNGHYSKTWRLRRERLRAQAIAWRSAAVTVAAATRSVDSASGQNLKRLSPGP